MTELKPGGIFEKHYVPLPDLSNERIFPHIYQVKALIEPKFRWRLVEEYGPDSFIVQEDGRLLFSFGFTDEERSKFTELLDSGYIDTYRYFYPDKEGVYSWWSYRFKAREKNAGWRIDYFCVSKSLKDRLAGTQIHTEILGSDHCPVELQIKDRDET